MTWSPGMVENLVEEIGHEMHGRTKAYYLIPILIVQRNGLREIRSDDDTRFVNFLWELGTISSIRILIMMILSD
jgi:hypothetical protein